MGTVRVRDTKKGRRYYAEVYVNGARRGKTHRTKKAADRWVIHMEDGGISSTRKVQELLEKYKREVSPRKRGAKWEIDRLNLISKMNIADVRLDRLDKTHIVTWRDQRLDKVSGESVRREWTLLNHALNLAVREWEWLTQNPMSQVKKPPKNPERTRVFSDKEVTTMLFVLGHPADTKLSLVGDCLLFILETAVRPSELTRLRPEHIRGNIAFLSKDITKDGYPRNVPLSKKAIELINKQPKSSKIFNISSDHLSALFRKYRIKAGLEDLVIRDARRTALTRLSKIYSALELAKISGHRNLATLLNHYYVADVNEMAERIDS